MARELHLAFWSYPTVSRVPVRENGEPAIERKEAHLRQVISEVEELVAIFKALIAKTPEHRWERQPVRNRFRVFKRCVEELEEASEG